MKTNILKILLVAIISISLLPGCLVVRERGYHNHYYRHHEPPRYYGHY